MPIHDNVAAVEARIVASCARAGRQRSEVTLVAVSKTFSAGAVSEAIAAGIREIGENRVQEARDKKALVRGAARWHLIGHLQSNKAKDAVRLFDVIEAVDGIALGEKIARAAAASGKTQEMMLEVNIGNEPQKSGVSPSEAAAVLTELRTFEAIRVIGLMAIPPLGQPEDSREYFRDMHRMRGDLGLEHLSMGMSEDFEIAIEEGSTIVRVGRAIFGSRN